MSLIPTKQQKDRPKTVAQSVIRLGSSFYLPENKAAWRMPERNSLVGLNANAAG